MRLPLAIALTATLMASSSSGAELTVLRGNEPLRANINAERDTVRLLFIGAPT